MNRILPFVAALFFGQNLLGTSNAAAVAKVPGQHKLLMLNGDIVKWGKPELGAGATVTYALATASTTNESARNCRHVDRLDRLVAISKIDMTALQRELDSEVVPVVWTVFPLW